MKTSVDGGDVLFRRDPNVLISLPDGTELAASVRRPADGGPVPAIVSYIPYQKDAMFAAFFDRANDYFASHGYAVVIADLRGLGGSSGSVGNAGDPQEGPDAAAVIDWTAAQPWCDGSVGMWGVSYGAITTFRAAAERPVGLKAFVAIEGCLDIYRDGGYPGGVRHCIGTDGAWGPMMLALQLMPPMWQDPEGRWEEVWRRRLEQRPIMLDWPDHPTLDEFWAGRRTVADRIEAPGFLIGGWRDIFPEAMVRAYERIPAEKRLLMGPWLHGGPDASPFVAIEYLPMMRRWWDRWLRGVDVVGDPDPAVTLYVQDSGDGAGWRHEPEWPIADTQWRRLALRPDHTLASDAGDEHRWLAYRADPTTGAAAGLWEPLALGVGLPLDQGDDDAASLTFTTEPFDEDVEIIGDPLARLRLRVADGRDATVVVKLVAVGAGRGALITSGIQRVSHRDGSAEPKLVDPAEEVVVEVPLATTAYRIRAGEQLRVSVACADFPRFWPEPENVLIELQAGGEAGSLVSIPLVPVGGGVDAADPPPADPSVNRFPLTIAADPIWTIERDVAHSGVAVTTGMSTEFFLPDDAGRMAMHHVATASVRRDRPDAARVLTKTQVRLATPLGQDVVINTSADVRQHGMTLRGRIDVDGELRYEGSWDG